MEQKLINRIIRTARRENWTYRDSALFISRIRQALKLKKTYSRKLIQLPTDAEWESFFTYLIMNYDFMTCTFFNLLKVTGLRISEAAYLQKDQIDFRKRQIFVRSGKGSKDRIVPFQGSIYTDLHELTIHTEKYIFINRLTGLPYNARYWEMIARQICQACQINTKLTPHTFRHQFATKIVNEQGIEVAKELLGHESIATTSDTYTHISIDKLQEKYNQVQF